MNSHSHFLLVALVAALAPLGFAQAQGNQTKLAYPVAHTDNTVDNYFGVKVSAPYQWMENLNAPKLHQWVNAENQLTDSYLAKIPIRDWMKHRLEEYWNFEREGTPNQWAYEPAPDQLRNGALFFDRNSGLQNQNVVYEQSHSSAKPREVLDPNKLSKDGSIALAQYVPSPNGKYLAYALSNGGSDWETIHVMDVATGRTLPDTVQWVKFSNISWTHDNEGFFYSRYPKPPTGERAISHAIAYQKLYYHQLGTKQGDDKLIYSMATHPDWGVSGTVSEDGHYLFLDVFNGTSVDNRLYYVALGNAEHPNFSAPALPLFTKGDASYSIIGNTGDTLYLRTTLDAPRGRIVAASLTNPSPTSWRVAVPQRQHAVLANAVLTRGRILANYQVVAKSELELFSSTGKLLKKLPLPAIGTVSGMSARNDSDFTYYAFTSFLYPTTIFKFDVGTGKTSTFFEPKVKFDRSLYETKQVFYTSKDGTKVPMFIVARKGIQLNGSHPTIIYAYGGFDDTVMPSFRPILPVWLEMGGVYAVANIRGGGAYGEAWHRAGMLGRKQNVFDDFAWAAKYLIAHGYTSSKHLGIQGYSNGGLLTGASITQRPSLFGAAYIGHGVLDMLRYQKFSGGAFWVSEFGSSDNKEGFRWLIKYSPLQNIHSGTCYPPTFITTSWDDDRVVPSHEFKFTAKLQQAQGCDNPILLRTTGSTAHNYMPTSKQIQQTADVWAFEAYNLGVTQAPTQ